jgi:hypothetical protein
MAGEFTVNDSPLSILQAVSTDKQTSTPFGNGPGRGDILNARIWFFYPLHPVLSRSTRKTGIHEKGGADDLELTGHGT